MANVYIGTATYASGVQAPAIGEAVTAESVGIGFSDLADRTAANNATGSLLVTSASLNYKIALASSITQFTSNSMYYGGLTKNINYNCVAVQTDGRYNIWFGGKDSDDNNCVIAKTSTGGTSWSYVYDANPQPSLGGINDILYVSGVGLYSVADNSLFISSSNGGSSWATVYSGSAPPDGNSASGLNKIAVSNDLTQLVIVGENAQIWTCFDLLGSGAFVTESPAAAYSAAFLDVCFASSSSGRFVAVGNNGAIQTREEASGSAWVSRTSGTSTALFGVSQKTNSNIIVAGGSSGVIVKSSDGGLSWSDKSISNGSQILNMKYFSEAGVFVAQSQNGAYVSFDDGETWSYRSKPKTIQTMLGISNTNTDKEIYWVGQKSLLYVTKIW